MQSIKVNFEIIVFVTTHIQCKIFQYIGYVINFTFATFVYFLLFLQLFFQGFVGGLITWESKINKWKIIVANHN